MAARLARATIRRWPSVSRLVRNFRINRTNPSPISPMLRFPISPTNPSPISPMLRFRISQTSLIPRRQTSRMRRSQLNRAAQAAAPRAVPPVDRLVDRPVAPPRLLPLVRRHLRVALAPLVPLRLRLVPALALVRRALLIAPRDQVLVLLAPTRQPLVAHHASVRFLPGSRLLARPPPHLLQARLRQPPLRQHRLQHLRHGHPPPPLRAHLPLA